MPYRVEYASSNRAKCKGPVPCKGNTIAKGSLRHGTLTDINGNSTFHWRHWGCVTKKILSNMKEKVGEAEDLDGFDDMKPEDQEKIKTAWEKGQVADEDIPETARKEGEEDDQGRKRKKAISKKKKAESESDQAEEATKTAPSRTRSTVKKAAKKPDSDVESADEESGEKPQKRSNVGKGKKVDDIQQEDEPKKKRAKWTQSSRLEERSDESGDEAEEIKKGPARKEAIMHSKKPKTRGKAKKTAEDEDEKEEIKLPSDLEDDLTDEEDPKVEAAKSGRKKQVGGRTKNAGAAVPDSEDAENHQSDEDARGPKRRRTTLKRSATKPEPKAKRAKTK